MTIEAIKEYGLEHFGRRLQNENATLREMVAAANACGMDIGFLALPADDVEVRDAG